MSRDTGALSLYLRKRPRSAGPGCGQELYGRCASRRALRGSLLCRRTLIVIESEEEVVGGRHPSETSLTIGPLNVIARA